MQKEQIMKIFRKEVRKTVHKQDNADLKLKLLQTTEKFVRTFDYELPKVRGVKGKLKRFIKRGIRKFSRFITKPYAEKMLMFQESICELLGMYITKYDDIYQRLDELNRRQNELETKIETKK